LLVLTRRVGDATIIGGDIVVTVLEVRHDQVRIGIDAPRDVAVHREEVYRQLVAQNEAAVASADRAAELRRPVRRPSRASRPSQS
jgi:carbon storage regulator